MHFIKLSNNHFTLILSMSSSQHFRFAPAMSQLKTLISFSPRSFPAFRSARLTSYNAIIQCIPHESKTTRNEKKTGKTKSSTNEKRKAARNETRRGLKNNSRRQERRQERARRGIVKNGRAQDKNEARRGSRTKRKEKRERTQDEPRRRP